MLPYMVVLFILSEILTRMIDEPSVKVGRAVCDILENGVNVASLKQKAWDRAVSVKGCLMSLKKLFGPARRTSVRIQPAGLPEEKPLRECKSTCYNSTDLEGGGPMQITEILATQVVDEEAVVVESITTLEHTV